MIYKIILIVLLAIASLQMGCVHSALMQSISEIPRTPSSESKPNEFCGKILKSGVWSMKHLLKGAYYGFKTAIVPLNEEVDRTMYRLKEGDIICVSGTVKNEGAGFATLFGYKIRSATIEELDKSLLDSTY